MMIKQRPTCNVAGVQGSLTRGKLVRDTTDNSNNNRRQGKLMYALAPTRVASISSSLDNASVWKKKEFRTIRKKIYQARSREEIWTDESGKSHELLMMDQAKPNTRQGACLSVMRAQFSAHSNQVFAANKSVRINSSKKIDELKQNSCFPTFSIKKDLCSDPSWSLSNAAKAC